MGHRGIVLEGKTSPSKLTKRKRGLDSTERLIGRVHANPYKKPTFDIKNKNVLGSP